MPLTIVLQDEHGNPLRTMIDSTNVLARCARAASSEMSLLKYVDPFGDTIFNALQAADVSAELDALMTQSTADDAGVLRSIKAITDACATGIHLYVKICGD